MEHFVTLFNSLFLPQGLALHASMQRHLTSYTLWILCMDDLTLGFLQKQQLPHVRLLKLSDCEDEKLLAVKATRSVGEYCWTLTPQSFKFVWQQEPSIERITYLDADVWFRQSIEPIWEEFSLSRKSVLITDHAYSAALDHTESSGRYCVQFLTFTRAGESVRQWWEDRCLEWCFAHNEDGKFGDQKYLNDWPTRFPRQVHVLAHPQWTLGPWNATRFPYSEALLWHFHGSRVVRRAGAKFSLTMSGYPIPLIARKHVYGQYSADIHAALLRCADILELLPFKRVGLFSRELFIAALKPWYYTLRDWYQPAAMKVGPVQRK